MSHRRDYREDSIFVALGREGSMHTDMDPELKQWVEMLRSPQVDDRLVAVKTLQHLGDEEVIDPLIETLGDESPAVQKIAVTTLWELANPVELLP